MLDDAADLFVAADHGVHLARPGAGREVLAVLGEGLVGGLGVGGGDALRSAHGLERGEDALAVEADGGEGGTERRGLGEGEQDVLGRHEVVLHGLGLVLGLEQERVGLGRKPGLTRGLREPGRRASCPATAVARAASSLPARRKSDEVTPPS
jgi:hypothetical protein